METTHQLDDTLGARSYPIQRRECIVVDWQGNAAANMPSTARTRASTLLRFRSSDALETLLFFCQWCRQRSVGFVLRPAGCGEFCLCRCEDALGEVFCACEAFRELGTKPDAALSRAYPNLEPTSTVMRRIASSVGQALRWGHM